MQETTAASPVGSAAARDAELLVGVELLCLYHVQSLLQAVPGICAEAIEEFQKYDYWNSCVF